MKNFILLFFLIPVSLSGQIQVSEIDYQLVRDDFPSKGFMKVADNEYFIEQGVSGTKVSLVEGDSLKFLHTLEYRPSASTLITNIPSENRNSNLHYEGEILYEIYWSYIYMINVVTGELIDIIPISQFGIKIQRDFSFGDNYFFFKSIGEGNSYVRFDRDSGTIDKLDSFVAKVGSKLYKSKDGKKLGIHNLETNENSTHPFTFSNIKTIQSHPSDVTSLLVIEDEFGIHLLKEDQTIQTLSCNVPADGTLKYVTSNRIVFLKEELNTSYLSIIDLDNCEEIFIQSLKLNQESYKIYSDPLIFDEYFIFGYQNDWQGDGEFHLFDIEKNQSVLIVIPIDFPILTKTVRYNENYYFLTSNHIHYIGSLPEFYRINLESYQIERISQHDLFETYSIVIGENQNDQEINIHAKSKDHVRSLLRVNDFDENLMKIIDFDGTINHGIHSKIYSDIWVDNKYFFYTSNGIFVMHNNETTRLANVSNYGISAFKQDGDNVYVLANFADGKIYAVKININDLSLEKILIEGVSYLYYKRHTSDNAIVNLFHSFNQENSTGFFDLASETFTTFLDLGLPDGTPSHISGNNVIYKTLSNDWYLINTMTKEVILTEIENSTSPDPYPDGNGGFYLDGWRFDDQVSFMYLNSQGKVSIIYEDFNHSEFADKFEGNVKSIAFDSDEEMIIIMTKDGEVRQKIINDDNLLYYQKFYWYESDNISFIETRNEDGTYATHTFNFDTEPLNITPLGRSDRLISVLESNTHSVLVFHDPTTYKLSFENFYYDSGSVENVTSIQSVQYNAIYGEPVLIDDNNYLFCLNDAVHGLEPYVYNLNFGKLSLLKDIRDGFMPSIIDDITQNPLSKTTLFTAIKNDGDRQLFTLDDALVSISEIQKDQLSNSIKILPNPTSDFITLKNDYSIISIHNIEGKKLSTMSNYSNGSKINVSDLNSGIYLIIATEYNNSLHIGRLVIER